MENRPAVDLAERLARFGGAARRGDLVRDQTQGRALARAVRDGEIVKHGGCYALPGAPDWLIRARQFRGLLSCISWAQEAGFAVLDRPSRVHLAVPRNRSAKRSSSRPSGAVILHRTAWAAPRQSDPPPVALPAVSAALILTCLEPLPAIVTVDSVLNRGTCTRTEIRACLGVPGRRGASAVLERCDGRSESPLESIGRVILRAAGLEVLSNVRIPGVGRVDLLVEGRLVVELDGFEHHGTRRAFGEDRRRDRALVSMGYRVLRFTYDEVVHSPHEVVGAVRTALAAPTLPPRRRPAS